MYLNFIPFYDWIIFHCRYILHFVYPFIHCRTLYCFWNRLPLIGTWTHMLGLEPTWSEMKWKFLSCVQLFATPWTVHGILQARILEWVAFPFSKGSSQPRNRTQVSCTAGRFFTSWTTREAQEYWSGWPYAFSRGSSRPRNQTRVSCHAGRFFTNWAHMAGTQTQPKPMVPGFRT